MPELIEQSTASLSLYAAPPAGPPEPPAPPAAPPPPEPSTLQPGLQVGTALAVPPVIDPVAWEGFAVFRETFLMHLTPPGYAAAFRTVGEMLYALILDTPASGPRAARGRSSGPPSRTCATWRAFSG